jgi:uncharacterized protein with FMN-binding domain
MRRAPIVLSATVIGTAAALGFHAHAPAAATPTAAVTTTSTTSSSSASSSSSPSSTKTVTSDVASNQYGNVQLRLTISGTKITAIQAIQVPNGDPKSAQINAYAEPVLRQAALSAQSANIDVVSGATYTSDSYKTALQSALDKAGLAS